jgi:outer membrane protein OmpA-like peptidoglycan-associated protein
MKGDTQKNLVLAEARATVVREYLVEHFGFDDSQNPGNGQAGGHKSR